jgi:hypothetical protein
MLWLSLFAIIDVICHPRGPREVCDAFWSPACFSAHVFFLSEPAAPFHRDSRLGAIFLKSAKATRREVDLRSHHRPLRSKLQGFVSTCCTHAGCDVSV